MKKLRKTAHFFRITRKFRIFHISNNTERVPRDVTAHINGNWKSRDMRGRLLDVDVKRGLRAAKALRAYPERIIPPNPLSDNTPRMSCDVTAHINGNRKSRDMRAYPERIIPPNPRSDNAPRVSRDVTAHINGNRKSRDMRVHSKPFIPPNPLSNNTERVSRDVTAHIDSNGKSRDMRGRLLDVDVKRGLRLFRACLTYKSAFRQHRTRAA